MTARDPDHLIRLGQLIDVALDVAPEQRRALLARACGNDKALFDDVCAMLGDLDRASSFLKKPAVLSLYPSHDAVLYEEPDQGTDPRVWASSAPEELQRHVNRPPDLRRQHTDRGFVRRHALGLFMTALVAIGGSAGVLWNQTRHMRSQEKAGTFDSKTDTRSSVERTRVPDAATGTGSIQRPEVAAALREMELGRQQMQRGADDSAEVSLRGAITLLTIAGDEASLDVADARRLLADALVERNHFVEAERELRAALHVFRLHLNADDSRLTGALLSLADLLAKSGRSAEADSVRDSAASGHRSDPMSATSA